MGLEDVPRCQHVKTNGTQCGSPALRRKRYCFFHEKVRRERTKIAASASAQRSCDLPLLEDANSVQMALMKVIQMLGCGQMDHKTAGLILYGLQTASINLRNTNFEAKRVTDVVIDCDTLSATCIHGPQWFAEDFEGDEQENKAEAADDGEDLAGGVQANADSSAHPAAKNEVKRVSLEEARRQVRRVVRDWLSEKATQKPQ
jgi:hypothetical protein